MNILTDQVPRYRWNDGMEDGEDGICPENRNDATVHNTIGDLLCVTVRVPWCQKFNWRLNRPVWYRMLYSCAHMTTVDVKGLNASLQKWGRQRVHGATVWVKKIPPPRFSDIFPKRVGIFNQFLHNYYTFLSTLDYKFLFYYLATLTKLCHTKREHPTNFYISLV